MSGSPSQAIIFAKVRMLLGSTSTLSQQLSSYYHIGLCFEVKAGFLWSCANPWQHNLSVTTCNKIWTEVSSPTIYADSQTFTPTLKKTRTVGVFFTVASYQQCHSEINPDPLRSFAFSAVSLLRSRRPQAIFFSQKLNFFENQTFLQTWLKIDLKNIIL